MTIATLDQTPTRLTDDMLNRFHERAPIYDRENRFLDEDFEELRRAGYLNIAVPRDLGGAGLSLAEVIAEQGRLAYHAPATALAVNMHIYWTGVAADLRKLGDSSLEWMLRESAAGEVFAAGHAETGNDLPVLLSTAKAEPADGGYRISGHKMFGSLTPVWTRLGTHAMDVSDPAAPRIVHAFVPRGTPGYIVRDTWDTLGMRPTRSDDTILDNASSRSSTLRASCPRGQSTRSSGPSLPGRS
jgi:alkylation response protein AidB-like acyl-CoA dehydrogenase